MAAFISSRHSRSLLLHRSSSSSSSTSFNLPLIRRLAKSHQFSEIESLLEPLLLHPPSLSPESHLASIISIYTSSGMLDKAITTLNNSPRTILSLNALLSSCNRSKTLSPRVPDLLSNLSLSLSLPPNTISFSILIKSLCLSRLTPKALLVLRDIETKGLPLTAVPYTTLIDSFYKEGKVEEAERLWNEMRDKKVCLDVAAYNVRVMHLAVNGKPDDVLGLMEEMRDEGMGPDVFTFNYLMICYCRHGRVDDAKRVFRGMEEKGCRANAATYKNLVYGLCKKGDFVGGFEVFEDCLERGRVPDLGSVMMLVKGLMRSCKVGKAKRVVVAMRKKFPEDFVGDWKKLEKVVGFNEEEMVPEVGN